MTEEITFDIAIPELVKQCSPEQKKEIYDYLTTMDEHHRKAYEIALDHLGSSFNIYRSNGFKEWKQSKSK